MHDRSFGSDGTKQIFQGDLKLMFELFKFTELLLPEKHVA